MDPISTAVKPEALCPLCRTMTPRPTLREAGWIGDAAVARLVAEHPRWRRADGACPACVQEAILEDAALQGRASLEGRIQSVWPLDPEAAFAAIPTPLRLRVDPRFTGRGSTIAFVDSGFFPHPDLIRPENRIVAWADATRDPIEVRWFDEDDVPAWPCHAEHVLWHGLMTSVTAAGNGWLSHGLYRGVAPECRVVLVQVSDGDGISDEAIERALLWLRREASRLRLDAVSCSVAADADGDDEEHAIDRAVAGLVADGVVVVAATGNDGVRHLRPPATAPAAISVGGLDDRNTVASSQWRLWHGNYGVTRDRMPKPEVVAPSLWTAAPVLPGSAVAREALELFDARSQEQRVRAVEDRIAELKLVTPHYQHVEGTSFAAPVVAGVVAAMREANRQLSPSRVKALLMRTATRVEDASDDRQGAGVADAGRAVAAALADVGGGDPDPETPHVTGDAVTFQLHDPGASEVSIVGSWNGWRAEGNNASTIASGRWEARLPRPAPGRYHYKFLIDRTTWLVDPANPLRVVDDQGHVNSLLDVHSR
jgi:serine protease AprX